MRWEGAWYNACVYREGSITQQLTAVYEKRADWIIAYLEEIPGVNTQGKTKEEARANLEDALMEFMAVTVNVFTEMQNGRIDL